MRRGGAGGCGGRSGRSSRGSSRGSDSRVRRCCCQHPLPSELHGRHFDACSSSIRQRFLPVRGCPIGLGVNLSVTATGPATELTSVAQAAPAEVIATSPTVLLCLLRRLADGLRPLTPEGSRPAFAWSDVAIGSTPVRPITGRHSLPPSSFTRSPIVSPCGSSTLAGGLRAYHVASQESSWVRPRLDAGGTSSAPDEFATSGPGHLPFGPSLSAPLACLCLRRLRRFTWVGPPTRPWSPTAAVLAVRISARPPTAPLAGEDPLSRGLRTPPLPATHASVGDCWQNSRCRHLLREEQHTSRDTLVSHADGQKPTVNGDRWFSSALCRILNPQGRGR